MLLATWFISHNILDFYILLKHGDIFIYLAKYVLLCNFLVRVDYKLTLGSLCRVTLLLASIFSKEVVLIALATTKPKAPTG